MAAGDIIRSHALDIKEVDVDTDEDIVKGEVVNDIGGAGFEQADAGGKGPFMVALEDHDYSEETTHKVKALFSGIVEVKKVTGAIAKGRYVEVSTTPGSVTLWDYATGSESDIVGIADENAASADTTVKIRLRC